MLETIIEPVEHLRYQGPIMGAATLVVIWILYKLSSRGLSRYLSSREDYKAETVQQFLFVWRYIWLGMAPSSGSSVSPARWPPWGSRPPFWAWCWAGRCRRRSPASPPG